MREQAARFRAALCTQSIFVCYVWQRPHGHLSFIRALYAAHEGQWHLRPEFNTLKDRTMDDYQEELLEYRALELDPVEPAEDATEL
jgi:hypothetical protein